MRRSNILEIITGLGAMSVFGSIAHADTYQQRLQAELNGGKDYSAAWAAASRAAGTPYAPDRGYDAKRALNQGKDYAAAWEAASRRTELVFSSEHVAEVERAKAELNAGKDYAAAWEATTNARPAARVQASSGGGAGGNGRTRSTK